MALFTEILFVLVFIERVEFDLTRADAASRLPDYEWPDLVYLMSEPTSGDHDPWRVGTAFTEIATRCRSYPSHT